MPLPPEQLCRQPRPSSASACRSSPRAASKAAPGFRSKSLVSLETRDLFLWRGTKFRALSHRISDRVMVLAVVLCSWAAAWVAAPPRMPPWPSAGRRESVDAVPRKSLALDNPAHVAARLLGPRTRTDRMRRCRPPRSCKTVECACPARVPRSRHAHSTGQARSNARAPLSPLLLLSRRSIAHLPGGLQWNSAAHCSRWCARGLPSAMFRQVV
jgi:hypothetical protein